LLGSDVFSQPLFLICPSRFSYSCLFFFRGMLLLTTTMTPKDNRPIRAVVCFCHGYTDHTSYAKRVEYQRLCEAGIAFVGIEYEGHGRSDGALGLISDWEVLIEDVSSFFRHVTRTRFATHPAFLMGESMGGAISYCVYNRVPELFRGVVFVCPMCKISDDMLPPQYVIDFLKWLIGGTGTTSFLGYLPIAPSKSNLGDLFNRIPEKGLKNARCPLIYDRNPRLATARELINVTQRISNSLQDFAAPFLVLHGLEDRVTDPALSKALYCESVSKDKTLRLLEGMWHNLTTGEPDENIDLVFSEVISWIEARI
jgi:caffeoylshikimate esterase